MTNENKDKIIDRVIDFLHNKPLKSDMRIAAALIEELKLVKNCSIPDVSNLLCGSFEPDNKTSSATRCKCGREIWEHPKAT